MDLNAVKIKNILLNSFPAIIIFIVIYFIRGNPFLDDSYIFYRYAANWAAGYGPVFNLGEYVEGYSSLLWTALLALGKLFSLDPVKLAPVINLLLGIAILFLMSHISSLIQFTRPRLMAVFLPVFFALSYGFSYYTTGGMDTIIFLFVLLMCVLFIYRGSMSGKYLQILPFLVLLNIVRAEGPLYSVILLAVTVFFVISSQRRLPRELVLTTIAFLGITSLLFIGRYAVYGEWTPATVSAKGYSTFLVRSLIFEGNYRVFKEFAGVMLGGLAYISPVFLLGAWIPFVMLFLRKTHDDFLIWLMISCIAASVFVSVWAGGDFWLYKRHIVPVLPFLIISVVWAGDTLIQRYWAGPTYRKVVLAAASVVMLLFWTGFFVRPAIITTKYVEENNRQSVYLREIGTILRDMPVSVTLLSDRIGKISYYSGPHVYVRDIFGLTDLHNAKYGDVWCMPGSGESGVCGRTDYFYSFSTPFDIFVYTSRNMSDRFVSFCNENQALCEKYRFYYKKEWLRPTLYIIADVNHPVSTALEQKFGAVPKPIDENLSSLIQADLY